MKACLCGMKKKYLILITMLLIAAISITSVAASTLEELEIETEELEIETEELEDLLDSIDGDILTVHEELEEINMMITLTEAEMERTTIALEESEEQEKQQYENMKSRIQYMYENGESSYLELFFGAESFSDFLNLAEFIISITEYDRTMLEKYAELRETIEFEESNLLAEQLALKELQEEVVEKELTLSDFAMETTYELNEILKELEALEAEKEAVAQAEAEKEAAAQAEAEKEEAENSSDSSIPSIESSGDSYSASATEIELFAAILDCEALANYDAMLAVATVIMNRVEHIHYPNTITGVIYQSGQFSPVWTGKLERKLALGVTAVAYQVAEDAIAGARYSAVSDCYYFLYSPTTSRDGYEIGGNTFFTSW